MRWLLSILLLGLLGAVNALSSTGNRLLVVLENFEDKRLFSTFFSDLESRGFHLSYESPKSNSLSLFHLGERAYDHLLILPPKSKGLGPALTANSLLDFINAEGNILLALSGGSPTPNAIGSFLLELDLVLSPDRAPLIVDHFNYDTLSAKDDHDVLLLERPGALRQGLKSFFAGDGIIAFPRAAGQAFGISSELVAPILRAPPTAYSYDKKAPEGEVDDTFATGSQVALVSAMQARNNARLSVVGSVESLQDRWFDVDVQRSHDAQSTKTLNREFAKQVTAWTFQEAGVLKAGEVKHYQQTMDGLVEPANASGQLYPLYRVKSDVAFTIELSEYDLDHWSTFDTPVGDKVQLEFSMLSPFYRLDLRPIRSTKNSTIYGTNFTVPDQHGIFSFRVNYKRPFLSNIEEKHEVTIRHFAHDEFPRSYDIRGAYTPLAGLWVVILGFVMFVIIWLYSAPAEPPVIQCAVSGKKTQ